MSSKVNTDIESPLSGLIREMLTDRWTLLIILSGIILRMLWLLVFEPEPIADAWYYRMLAENTANGHGYSLEGEPFSHFPPGYPLLLGMWYAIFGSGSAAWLNLVFQGLSLSLIWLLARRTGTLQTARIATAIFALYPGEIAYASLILSEPASLCLLLLAVYAQLRKEPVLAGLSWALAILIKPYLILLPFLIFFFRKDAFRHKLIIASVIIIIIGGWSTRNYIRTDNFVLISSNFWLNLWIGNHPDANGKYTDPRDLDPAVPTDIISGEHQAKFRQETIGFLKDDPGIFFSRMPVRTYHIYRYDVDGLWWNEQGMILTDAEAGFFRIWNRIVQYWYLLVLLLTAVSTAILYKKDRKKLIFPVMMIVYLTGVHLPFFGTGRFHYLMMPWMFMIIAFASAEAMKSLTKLSGSD